VKYIICDECGGFYELEMGESIEDFESCLCGGTLSHAELTPKGLRKTTRNMGKPQSHSYQARDQHVNKHQTINHHSENICPLCGQINKVRSAFCSKCGKILKTGGPANWHDYGYVLEEREKRRKSLRGLYERIDLWGVGCGIIFLIGMTIISNIIIFFGLVRLTVQNANEPTLFSFLGGVSLISLTIFALSGFISAAAIGTRSYIEGIVNGALVGICVAVVISIIPGIFVLAYVGIVAWLAIFLGGSIVYGILTGLGGLMAVALRKHTGII
jgi:ribosomal protein L37AE/L43A